MPTSPGDPTLERCDLAVVGAGPAGLAAAVAAADQGLAVALIDSAARPGGQYYRHPAPGLGAARPGALHHGWTRYTRLADRLAAHQRTGRVAYLPGRHVWTVQGAPEEEYRWALHSTAADGGDGGDNAVLAARGLLLATGAYERQLPFPGWTLPGVVGAGGAQAMLKSGLVLPGQRVVVAGSGPLLLAVAASLAAAGARVPAVVEASGYLGYGRAPRALAANPGKAAEGAGYAAALLRHRVRPRGRTAVIEAHESGGRVGAVTVAGLDRDWRPVPGSGRRIACDALAVGHGLVPQLELATGLGCQTRTARDGTPALRVDAWQRTSVDRVWAAGEPTGVGGVRLALYEGELAGRAAAAELLGAAGSGGAGPVRSGAVRRARVRASHGRIARLRGFAETMAAVHRPGPGWTAWLRDDTEVCRCEEVTAGAVRAAVTRDGAADARTVKLLTRAGMGWCQGRMCGPAVACLTSGGDGGTALGEERRPLSCPVPLGHLAAPPPAHAPPD